MTSGDFEEPTYDSFRGVAAGSRVAGYLIEEQIGAGGMAVVFRARDEVLGRLAAVKIIAPAMANDEEFRARFLRESRTVAAVDSLHIIPVYGAGEAGGLLYIATRYVPGGDLAALVRRSGGFLAPARAAALVTQVASALDAAHAAGLVHRDVKPQNILVDTVPERPEHAFLSDFGLSKGTASSTGLTVSGQFLGTPDYSAPEQIRGGHVNGRTDQYALAGVAFVLLTGSLPFHRDETVSTMFAHLHDPVPLATRFRPELPAAVNGVLARALAKSPAERYARCADFADALQDALTSTRPATARAALPRALPERPAPRELPAAAPDPWAWLARTDKPRVSAGQPVWKPPAGFQRSPSAPAAPQPADRPQPQRAADWQHPSLPPAFAAEWEAALKENAAYSNTTTGRNRSAGRTQSPPAGGQPPPGGGRGDQSRGRNFQMALIGGAAALVIGAASLIYFTSHGSPAGAVSASAASAKRPSKPTLTSTLTVPDDLTVNTAWISPDGKLVAASGLGSNIYVWNTADPSRVTTLTAPEMQVGATIYSTVIDNVAFSADGSSLVASVYPNVPAGAPTPSSQSDYDVYRWNLATGKRTLVWRIETPSTVIYANDNNTVVTYQNNVVSQVTLSPQPTPAGPPVTLPGGADQSYPPPYELDLGGDRMIYHPSSDETYVWDFNAGAVVAKLKSSAYTVLSTDGKTILAANPSNYPTLKGDGSSAPPTLWDVATQSAVTPTDPRWKEQLREPYQVYSWETYSVDGSVILTKRAGGNLDLWSTDTHKYLLTVKVPDYSEDGFTLAGPGGSDVVVLTTQQKVNGQDEYRQIKVWQTPLNP